MKKIPPSLVGLALAGGIAAGACAANHHATLSVEHTSKPGVVTGQLTIEGGPPIGGNPRPMPGTVTFRVDGRAIATVRAGANGRFSEALAPGSYVVQACSTEIYSVSADGQRSEACSQPVEVQVASDRTTTVQIPNFIVP